MSSARNLFVRITHRVSRWPDLPVDDQVADFTHTALPGECDRITPPAPKRPEPSPAPVPSPLPVGQAWPSPRTWLDATVTEADAAREERQLARLAALTDQLGSPLAAAQHIYAPHLEGHRPCLNSPHHRTTPHPT